MDSYGHSIIQLVPECKFSGGIQYTTTHKYVVHVIYSLNWMHCTYMLIYHYVCFTCTCTQN